MQNRVNQIMVGDLAVDIREMTVAEVMSAMKMEEASEQGVRKVHPIDLILFEDMTLIDIQHMTNLNREQINSLTPNQLRQVADECKQANSHFFGMRKRLNGVVSKLGLPGFDGNS